MANEIDDPFMAAAFGFLVEPVEDVLLVKADAWRWDEAFDLPVSQRFEQWKPHRALAKNLVHRSSRLGMVKVVTFDDDEIKIFDHEGCEVEF
jgi:hypothetical protein